ncbi:histidine phosphatase family protein [Halodesulfovibrio marinisediminis]|uniref:Probable phosphoglycerate mutase n=1 Tax=Halodesulfovibrio marinisediminis DSM 17456 TaxID=1121457 RepID=A0A1N6HC11_9BACT|nr:histidine phosphatase family protein [Halodesulfovibrio marinisediminis]SIO17322.1 probable phosphoglycerate mutase [Halodesulfovibrio marinisediminis DSM 17456]
MKQTQIGLLRHAPTAWNAIKRIQGQYDVPLQEDSFEHINSWASSIKRHSWTRIVTSDLSRAHLTALALNRYLHVPVELDSRLREQDWGIWTGDSISRLREIDSEEVDRQEAAGWDFTPPNGESRKEVLSRTLEALHEATRRWEGENILVVTHQGNISTVANHLLQKKFLPEEGKLIKKYTLHRISAETIPPETTQFSVIALNEVL